MRSFLLVMGCAAAFNINNVVPDTMLSRRAAVAGERLHTAHIKVCH